MLTFQLELSEYAVNHLRQVLLSCLYKHYFCNTHQHILHYTLKMILNAFVVPQMRLLYRSLMFCCKVSKSTMYTRMDKIQI